MLVAGVQSFRAHLFRSLQMRALSIPGLSAKLTNKQLAVSLLDLQHVVRERIRTLSLGKPGPHGETVATDHNNKIKK